MTQAQFAILAILGVIVSFLGLVLMPPLGALVTFIVLLLLLIVKEQVR